MEAYEYNKGYLASQNTPLHVARGLLGWVCQVNGPSNKRQFTLQAEHWVRSSQWLRYVQRKPGKRKLHTGATELN